MIIPGVFSSILMLPNGGAPAWVPPGALAHLNFTTQQYFADGAVRALSEVLGGGLDPTAIDSTGMLVTNVAPNNDNSPRAIGPLFDIMANGLANGMTVVVEWEIVAGGESGSGPHFWAFNNANPDLAARYCGMETTHPDGGFFFDDGTFSYNPDQPWGKPIPGIQRMAYTFARDVGGGLRQYSLSHNGRLADYTNDDDALQDFTPVRIDLWSVQEWAYWPDNWKIRTFTIYAPKNPEELAPYSAWAASGAVTGTMASQEAITDTFTASGVVTGTGTPKRALYLGSAADPANLTSYTFSNFGLGNADANRMVVLAVMWSSSSTAETLSSASIGGIAASIIGQNSTVTRGIALIRASVPTGTVGDVVLTFSAGVLSAEIFAWRAVLATHTPLDSGTAGATDQNERVVSDLQVQAGGFVIAACNLNDDNSNPEVWWTGPDVISFDATPLLGEATGKALLATGNTDNASTTNDLTFKRGAIGGVDMRVVAASW